ncbi:hypothetical protein HK102_011105, partial [Quaeritorhiza haematococci]
MRPRFVGVTSFAGQVGLPRNGSYVASKYAATGFLETLRREIEEQFGIYVVNVMPGAMQTPLVNAYPSEKIRVALSAPPDIISAYGGLEEEQETFKVPPPIPGVDTTSTMKKEGENEGEKEGGLPKPETVAEVVVREVVGAWGRPRGVLVVGVDAKILQFINNWVPETLGDYTMNLIFGKVRKAWWSS